MMPLDFISAVLGEWSFMFPLAVALLMWLSVDLSLLGSFGGGQRRRVEAQHRIAAMIQEAPVVDRVRLSRRCQRRSSVNRSSQAAVEGEQEVLDVTVHRVRIPASLRVALKPVKHRVVVVVVGDFARSPRMQYHAMSLATSGRFDQVTLVGLQEGNALSEALLRCGETEEEDFVVVNGKVLRIDRVPSHGGETMKMATPPVSPPQAPHLQEDREEDKSTPEWVSDDTCWSVVYSFQSKQTERSPDDGDADAVGVEVGTFSRTGLHSYTDSEVSHLSSSPDLSRSERLVARTAFPPHSINVDDLPAVHKIGCQINAQYLVTPPQLPAWCERVLTALPLPSKINWLLHTVYRVIVLTFIFFSLLIRASVIRVNTHGQLEVTTCVLFQTPPCIPVLLIARYLVRPLALVYNCIVYYCFIIPASLLHAEAVKDVKLHPTTSNRNASHSNTSGKGNIQSSEQQHPLKEAASSSPATSRVMQCCSCSSSSSVGLAAKLFCRLHPRRVFYPTYIVDWHNYGYTILEAMHRPQSITSVYRFLELKCCGGDINLTVSQAMRRSLRRNLLGKSSSCEDASVQDKHVEPPALARASPQELNSYKAESTKEAGAVDLVSRDAVSQDSSKSSPSLVPSPPQGQDRPRRLSEDVYVLYDVAPSFFAPASRRRFVEEVVKPLSRGFGNDRASTKGQNVDRVGANTRSLDSRHPTHQPQQHSTVRHRRHDDGPDAGNATFSNSTTSCSSLGSGDLGIEPPPTAPREKRGGGENALNSILLAEGEDENLPAPYAYDIVAEENEDGDDDEDADNPLNAAGVRRLLREIANSTTVGGTTAATDTEGIGVGVSGAKPSLHAETWGISPPPAWVLEEAADMTWEPMGATPTTTAAAIPSRGGARPGKRGAARHGARRLPERGRDRDPNPLVFASSDDEYDDEYDEEDEEEEEDEYERAGHHGALFPALPSSSFSKRRGLIVVGSTSWTPDDDYSVLIEALHRLDFRLCQLEQQQQGYTVNGSPLPILPTSANREQVVEGHSPVRSPTLHGPSSSRVASGAGGACSPSSSIGGRARFFSRRSPLNVWVLITGKGPGRARFEAQIKAAGLSSHVVVSTVYLQSYLQYSITLGAADVGLCLHHSSSGLDLPMKAVDMLGAGLPVVALDYEAMPELLGEQVRHSAVFGAGPNVASPLRSASPRSSSLGHPGNNASTSSFHSRPVSSSMLAGEWDTVFPIVDGTSTPTRFGAGPQQPAALATTSPGPHTEPETLFDSLKAYTYGWTFKTSRDLEELLAAFIGYHNESYWQASEPASGPPGLGPLSSFHSSVPTSPTSTPSPVAFTVQQQLSRPLFPSSQHYLCAIADPYAPFEGNTGLPSILNEVRQRVCQRRALGKKIMEENAAVVARATAAPGPLMESQNQHAATWEDQWNAVVDPILKDLLQCVSL